MINGDFDLRLDGGVFIPADSKLVVNLGTQERNLELSDVVDVDSTSGEFYIEDFNISGFGEGYGKPEVGEIYPDVYFKLLLKESMEILPEVDEPSEVVCGASLNCEEWGDCINSYQTRSCVEINEDCIESSIDEEQECSIEEEEEEEIEIEVE